MNDPPSRVPVFLSCTARDAPEIRPSKEFTNHVGCPTRSTDHPASDNFFPHGFPQDDPTLGSLQGAIVIYVALRFRWVILEVTDKSCCKAFHHMILHFVGDQIAIQFS